jgi:hypothetical protein
MKPDGLKSGESRNFEREAHTSIWQMFSAILVSEYGVLLTLFCKYVNCIAG